jgi:TRAP-type C4-dicarboxylate transport system substrate-binding protein
VKVHELVRFHTEIPGTPTLYTATFFLAMNRAKYDGMPADLRAVMDKSLGMAFADMAGNMWDTEAKTVSAMVRARSGNTINVISEEEKAKWVKATEPVHAAWIEQMKGRNIDGAALIAEARALIAKHEKAAS